MKKIKIAVLPGDGIGKNVIEAALPVFDILNIPVTLEFGEIGWESWLKKGNPVPPETWDLINRCDTTLLGAITSKPKKEAFKELPNHLKEKNYTYVSPVIQLRQNLSLFANVRPVKSILRSGKDFNFCIIRENTEGLYAGFDYHPTPKILKDFIADRNNHYASLSEKEITCSLRLQTKEGLEKLYRFSFEYAKLNGFDRVTLAEKPNVLRESAHFTRHIFESISKEYPHINSDIHNVDAIALWMVKKPESFGVIVAENMFGDILSDLGAGVMGGLGFAPSANIGPSKSYFEPVHGSAPRVQQDGANPCAMFLTIGLLLKHHGYVEECLRIEQAVANIVNQSAKVTYDLGGNSKTLEMAAEILRYIKSPHPTKSISFIATGNEILNGDIQEKNAYIFSKEITKAGGHVSQITCCPDSTKEIQQSISYSYHSADAIITTGGIGPTNDDQTRNAVSNFFNKDLHVNQYAWDQIKKRLKKFSIDPSIENKKQALIPETSTLIPNNNGTAHGCYIQQNNRALFMLPGPTKEAKEMFNSFVLPKLRELGFLDNPKNIFRFQLLNVIESEIAQVVDEMIKNTSIISEYRWHYPYVEIKLSHFEDEPIVLDNITQKLSPFTVSISDKLSECILKEKLSALKKKIFIKAQHPLCHLKNRLKHDLLLFDDSASFDDFCITLTKKECISSDISVVDLNIEAISGSKIIYQHNIAIPNRGPEISLYEEEYFLWQIGIVIQSNLI